MKTSHLAIASGIRIIRGLNLSFFLLCRISNVRFCWPQFIWIDETAAQMALLSIIPTFFKLILIEVSIWKKTRVFTLPSSDANIDHLRMESVKMHYSPLVLIGPENLSFFYSAGQRQQRYPDRLLWIILCLYLAHCFRPAMCHRGSLWEAV